MNIYVDKTYTEGRRLPLSLGGSHLLHHLLDWPGLHHQGPLLPSAGREGGVGGVADRQGAEGGGGGGSRDEK